ncbi:uncharacterized protein CcaverHIS019_0607230 [Cutaneotrichosporon cavernicola]|uniref:Uncharacterized protein n=1 Tax=Cutaneotrichosporon cavernicola TaxID=279322 RepID=A0AA48L928_9TREE|nr:uncharacterized protein CcaverHIS019_0607230 [Cutaneotrichosporon cavernicola]BEI94264.1 hypothetical protein CcaverHIS019_0607230 [Cutaneotrichosporon cavernicola]BEJ02042.1 hypothetical protein CcaverHIS631_0607240 [Cutaneotrichosporon cavernicola]BEJ09803.1 hypothetical protein CcaverHIS641_0607180 [Cutaneotrichosporon cavernicola]
MSRPINTHSPPRASASRPRINALSPLQTFSSLSPESDVIKTKSWAVSTSPQSITPSSLSRSGSANSLSRSLSGRDFAFTSRRGTNSSDVSDTTTRLLLVKAPSSPDQPLRKSSQSCSSLASVAVSASSPPQPARKRSFAGASFGGMSPISPMTTLRREASNPDLTAAQITPTGGLVGVGTGLTQLQNAPQLSPEEIMGLGRGIMAPVAASDSGSVTPGRNRRRKSTGSFKNVMAGGAVHAEPEPIALEPVKYVEMDAGVHLPFHNRPAEVKELFENPRNTQLLALLQQTFPEGPLRPNWKDIDVHEWNWSEFYAHLTTVDRAECEDYPWVELARDAVRQHSVSLWENLGTCLGCDTELMMAGEEDETPASWGGLGLSEEGEYDPYQRRVWIEGLEPVDPDAEMREERELSEAFDDYEFGAAGGFSSMATIGEERPAPSGPTPAQRAGKGEVTDPLRSPEARNHPLAHDFAMASSASSASSLGSVGSPVSSSGGPKRGRSFVGLSITTSAPTFAPRTPGSYEEREDQQQRTPGNPLFVSSFNTLSLSPTLGRKQSVSYGVPAADADSFRGFEKPGHITRRASGTGLSESAITFVSDSSFDGPFR